MKQSINKATGLQVGFTTEWVVLDNSEWRALTTKETTLVNTEYAAQEVLKDIQVARQAKTEALASVKVTTTSGKVFDGRDIDQQRMVSAILSSSVINITETHWKLADNTIATISLDELKEALALSIQAIGNIVVGA